MCTSSFIDSDIDVNSFIDGITSPSLSPAGEGMGAITSCLRIGGEGDNHHVKKGPKGNFYDLIDESTWDRPPASHSGGACDVTAHDDAPVYQNANAIAPPSSQATPPSRVSPKPARQHPYDEITLDAVVANRQAHARDEDRGCFASTSTSTNIISPTYSTTSSSTTTSTTSYSTHYSVVAPLGARGYEGCGYLERGDASQSGQGEDQDNNMTYMNTGGAMPVVPESVAVEIPEAKQLNYVQVEFNSSNVAPGIRTRPPYEPTNYSSVIHSNGQFYTLSDT